MLTVRLYWGGLESGREIQFAGATTAAEGAADPAKQTPAKHAEPHHAVAATARRGARSGHQHPEGWT